MKFTSKCAGCFAGLACQERVEIVTLLQEKKYLNVSEIAAHFKLSQPTITHHLQYLKKAGIVTGKKKGKYVYYSLDRKCKLISCDIFS